MRDIWLSVKWSEKFQSQSLLKFLPRTTLTWMITLYCEPIAATGKGCFLTEMIGFTLFNFSRSIPDSLKTFFKGEL